MNGFHCRLFVRLCVLLIGLASCARSTFSQTGQWQTLPYAMPINPVHTALLYNGKVLIASGSGNVAGNTNFQAALWDPQAGTITTQPVTWDMFCNGMVVLPDGRPFVMGGTLQYDPFHGELKTSTYDPATNTFTNQQSMAHGRWYPTGTVLGDGRTMIFSGLNETGGTNSSVEFYSASSGWSAAFAAPWTPPLYPRMHVLPNGNVFYSGSTTGSSLFNPSNHTWTTNIAFTNYSGTRTYGTSVLFPLTPANNYTPKVIIMGGGSPSTSTTEIIDLSAATPKWVKGPNMSQPRIEMNATILPSGKILALGGSLNDEDTATASLNADLYDPGTNTFSSAGALVYARLYHSVSLLLPDATVWVAGGNPQRGTYEPHMEVYSPQYLFKADGTPATRPNITGTSSSVIGYGGAFQVQTPDAATISNVVLMRNGAVTHAFDMDQRYVGLSFTVGAGVLNVTGPPNGNIAPPGYYMLFILNSSGVPSIAKMLQVSLAANDVPPTGTITSPASNLTITAGQSVVYSGTGSDPDGTISAYSWSFPGGNPSSSNLANPGSVTYATLGTYVTTFTVTDNAGLTDPNPPTRTITVQAPPAITSAASTTFSVGAAGSFTVTTTGAPTPTLTETGALPSGVTFKDNGNGTGTLSGTPTTGSAGSYPITLTASNGVGSPASQSFTLTVNGSGGGGGSSNFAYVNGSVSGVYNASGTTSTTLSVALHQTPGAGHLLVCAATWQSPTATATMSDPNNGTWTAIGVAKAGVGSLSGYRGQMFYVPSAVSASTTVTLTISSAVAFRAFECAEYSYAGTIAALDGAPQYSATPSSGGVATVSGVTTSNSSDLVFADCLGVDTTCAAGSGYTGLNDANTFDAGAGSYGANFWGLTGQLIEYKVGAAAGSQSATFGTGTASENVILGLVTF
jgi:hypothetical protein